MADPFDIYSSNLGDLDAATNKYIDELISEAQGDRDFIVKKLSAEHELALGTDNAARAEFLEKVANSLEKRIGRIPYDYEKYTARELEDYAIKTQRLTENKTTAIDRLREDERVLKEESAIQAKSERIAKQEELASRGIIQGTLKDATGIAGQDAAKLNDTIAKRDVAIERAANRGVFDENLTATRGISDATLSKDRNVEDIKTKARRDAIDAGNTYSFGVEGADRSLSKTKAQLERERTLQKSSNALQASLITPQNYG